MATMIFEPVPLDNEAAQAARIRYEGWRRAAGTLYLRPGERDPEDLYRVELCPASMEHPGDVEVWRMSPEAVLILDAAGCIVLRTRGARVTVTNVDDWAAGLIHARTVQHLRGIAVREAGMADRLITVVRDGREVTAPSQEIRQHQRPDGRWCRWSGSRTAQPDGYCPDRCQQDPADTAAEDAARAGGPGTAAEVMGPGLHAELADTARRISAGDIPDGVQIHAPDEEPPTYTPDEAETATPAPELPADDAAALAFFEAVAEAAQDEALRAASEQGDWRPRREYPDENETAQESHQDAVRDAASEAEARDAS